MNKLHLLIIFCILGFNINAQSLSIKDFSTKDPISKASIQNSKGDILFTNNIGVVDISIFKDDNSLLIKAPDYQEILLRYIDLKKINFNVSLVRNINSLDEVIVSVTRFNEKKSEIPLQIQLITQNELLFNQSQTSADVLQNTGNIFVQKSQAGGGSPIIRGFEANKVLITLDGIRMNNAIYRGGHLQNVITIDNNMLEKVEIAFGTSSVLYGSDALGGSMHFFTKNPYVSISNKVSINGNGFIRYSTSNKENTGHIDFNIGMKKMAFLSSFTYSSFDDLRQGNNRNNAYEDFGKRFYYIDNTDKLDTKVKNNNPNIQVRSGYKQYDFLQKIRYQPNDNINHTLNIQYSTTSNIDRYDRLTETKSNGDFKNAEWYYGPQNRILTSYQINIKSKYHLFNEFKTIMGYQHIEESRHNRKYGSLELNHRREKLDIYSLNTDFIKTIKKHTLHYGIEVTNNKVNSTAKQENILTGILSSLDTRYPDGGSTTSSYATYVTDLWKINSTFLLNGGLRYTFSHLYSKFNDKTFFPFPFNNVTQNSNTTNGNLGIIIKPNKTWQITINGSSGFRTPNVDDMSKVFESSAGTLIIPNPNLKSEYTYNGELEVSKKITQNIKLEFNGYYTSYKDAIITKKSTFMGQSSILYNGQQSDIATSINAKSAYIYGFNANVNATLMKNVLLSSTINYTYGRVKGESGMPEIPLDHIPPLYGKTSITYKNKKIQAEMYFNFNAWKDSSDYSNSGEDNLNFATPEGTPSWNTLNTRIAYTFSSFAQINVALENIFDSNYRVFASGISASGRNLSVSLIGRF